MKKKILIPIIIISILAIVGALACLAYFQKANTVGTITLSDYNELIGFCNNRPITEEFTEPFGSVGSVKEAKKLAESIWIELFGDSVTKKKPYRVFYDDINQVWLVQGTVFFMGGGPNILIQKSDGKVLAIWQYKD
ncbi:MAG: YbbC/YhhH family protein [Oscillospiraceae bacterium]|jgi:uncharacterized protein YdeI (BOF family)|nr:YbbC/YhhH family protein [Oscillospiraceae bacterium]